MFKKTLLAGLITAFSVVTLQSCGGEAPKTPAEEKQERSGGLTDRMRDRGEEPAEPAAPAEDAAPTEGAEPAQQ